jgi:5'/3'-nucleotidase SurE
MKGYKSIAISKVFGSKLDLSKMFHIATSVILKLYMYPLDNYFFNINIPDTEDLSEKVIFTNLSSRKWEEEVSLLIQQDKQRYYTIGGYEKNSGIEKGSDADILNNDIISVTPLTDNYTYIDFFKHNKKKEI